MATKTEFILFMQLAQKKFQPFFYFVRENLIPD
jgi:hypothetical protein